MGGTSFDVCLIESGVPDVTTDGIVAGYRISVPMVGIHTIGSGGGSLIDVNGLGMLQVGPGSAGAYPGPVCYARGGVRPTVTDANAVLGFLDPVRFWGGRLRLDIDAARRAIAKYVAEPLALDTETAAWGAFRVANENMADAIREVSTRRGHDLRDFALVVAGGAGPAHIGAIADELSIPLVIVPRLASGFCALGGLLGELRREVAASLVAPLAQLDLLAANDLLARLAATASAGIESEGVPREQIRLERALDVRYLGQFSELTIRLDGDRLDDESISNLTTAFHARHRARNGYEDQGTPLELVSLRVDAVGVTDKPALPEVGVEATHHARPAGARQVYWETGPITMSVYDAAQVRPGGEFQGPALFDQGTTTVVVPPAFAARVDRFGSLLLHRADADLEGVLQKLRGQA
jgi:N-methylhydantoinase A